MQPRDFTYWLQGFVEITADVERPSAQQWSIIKDHLQLVFTKETPDRDGQMLTELDNVTQSRQLQDDDLGGAMKYVAEGNDVNIVC